MLRVVLWSTCVLLWGLVFLGSVTSADLPLRTIWPLALAAAMCRTAVAVAAYRRRPSSNLLGLSSTVDTILLTGLLDLTGGPFNPFLVMYVVHTWLATVAASHRWGLFAGVVSAVGFTLVFGDQFHAGHAAHHRLNDFPTHLVTMWLSGVAVAELVTHYVQRANQALAEARASVARSERLAALTALAAGAAHELSTPLATIAVAARELERHATQAATATLPASSVAGDARLMRLEVERCRVILDSMTGRATTGPTMIAGPVPPTAIAELAQARLTDAQRSRLRVDVAQSVPSANTGPTELSQALLSLLTNAFDASAPEASVDLRIRANAGMVRFEVQDRGTGISDDIMIRVGEPFFTTKPGRGLGLGVFLARAVAERAGGSLQFDRRAGTTAILEVPADVVAS